MRGIGRLEIAEVLRPVARAAGLIILTFGIGTAGYMHLGPPSTTLLDAAYMTVITLTTVGYSEVVDLTGNDAGRIFTIILLLLGVGSFLYFFSTTTAFAVEGTLGKLFWRRRMNRRIAALRDHYIVCGGGHTGEHIVRELFETDRPVVLIESDETRIDALREAIGDFASLIGDATHDDMLQAAGIDHAVGLVAAVRDDKDNLIITISARILNPRTRIIARCVDSRVQTKLKRAGADAVVSPNQIGGLRMVSELVRPTVVTFLDMMLRERDSHYRVEEQLVKAGSLLDGRTIIDAMRIIKPRALIVALRHADGSWHYNPGPEDEISAGTWLVFIGSPESRAAVNRAATA